MTLVGERGYHRISPHLMTLLIGQPKAMPCMDLHHAHAQGSLGCTARPWF